MVFPSTYFFPRMKLLNWGQKLEFVRSEGIGRSSRNRIQLLFGSLYLYLHLGDTI